MPTVVDGLSRGSACCVKGLEGVGMGVTGGSVVNGTVGVGGSGGVGMVSAGGVRVGCCEGSTVVRPAGMAIESVSVKIGALDVETPGVGKTDVVGWVIGIVGTGGASTGVNSGGVNDRSASSSCAFSWLTLSTTGRSLSGMPASLASSLSSKSFMLIGEMFGSLIGWMMRVFRDAGFGASPIGFGVKGIVFVAVGGKVCGAGGWMTVPGCGNWVGAWGVNAGVIGSTGIGAVGYAG